MFTKEQQQDIEAYETYINLHKGKISEDMLTFLQNELEEMKQEFINNK